MGSIMQDSTTDNIEIDEDSPNSNGTDNGDSNGSILIKINNLPADVKEEDVTELAEKFGEIVCCSISRSDEDSVASVTFALSSEADNAISQLNEFNFNGSILKADVIELEGSEDAVKLHNNNNSGGNKVRSKNGVHPSNRGTGYPLRILVPHEYVGAIIGRKGTTIRTITTNSRARVDVHRNDTGGLEQVISIFGQPENCTKACKEIMLVMKDEAEVTNKGEIMLKMLADDRYCGRIIGKEGKVIKKIREDTDTKITVSNMTEIAAIYPDRVITVKGAIENMAKAEAAVSHKLRECFDKDMNMPTMLPPQHGAGFQANVPPIIGGIYNVRPNPYNMISNPVFHAGGNAAVPTLQVPPNPPFTEMCQIHVPNTVVGAIIGSGGANIKSIIRDSNAFVTIEQKRDDDVSSGSERTVTVKGTPEAQWRASFFIFDKLKHEGVSGNEEIHLKTCIRVPRSMVGRVIGKSGKNVRDIQRMTGAMIKLPEDQSSQGEETQVEIFGNFFATQNAMGRIRALVCQGQQQINDGSPRRSSPRNLSGSLGSSAQISPAQ